jgi:hypothetical protein
MDAQPRNDPRRPDAGEDHRRLLRAGVSDDDSPDDLIAAARFVPDARTLRWCSLLTAVSVVNIVSWIAIAFSLRPRSDAYVTAQLVLSGVFVAVCAFRSLFPRVDLERRCLKDTPLSAIAVGRSVATVAELCFAAQCALLVFKLADEAHLAGLRTIGLAIVPLIIVAQISCWYAVVSLNHLGHALEEILWAVMVALIAIALAEAIDRVPAGKAVWCAFGIVACAAAAYLMLAVDVPMYRRRWRESRRNGVRFLPLSEGLRDTFARRHVAHDWNIWRPEVPWMSLYFTAGVWLSLGLVFM